MKWSNELHLSTSFGYLVLEYWLTSCHPATFASPSICSLVSVTCPWVLRWGQLRRKFSVFVRWEIDGRSGKEVLDIWLCSWRIHKKALYQNGYFTKFKGSLNFYTPWNLKTSKNQRFSGVFRGYRSTGLKWVHC